MAEYDVIVVGGGLSGLTCARELKRKGHKVLLLEARERLGGRTETKIVDGDAIDVGGQWIGPTQTKTKALVDEFGLKTFPQYLKGKSVLEMNGGSRVEYSGLIPWVPSMIPFVPAVGALLDTELLMRKLDSLAKNIDLNEPWNSPNARQYDSISFETWLNQNAWTNVSKELINVANLNVFALEPREVSLLYTLFYLKASGTTYQLMLDGSELGAQATRVVGGTQQLSEKLAESIGTQFVKMGSPVRKIDHNVFGVTVHTDNASYEAKYVVVAIAPALAGRIQYNPPLPGDRDSLTVRMPMGCVIKVILVYKNAWWREKGYSGSIVNTTDKYPLSTAFDDSDDFTHLHPAFVGFIQGDSARKWAEKTAEERKEAIVQQLAEMLKSPEAHDVVHYEEKLWVNDEWSRGCYVGVMPPGAMTSVGKALRKPIGRIYWAGTETALIWPGYMEGAIDAGERTAADLNKELAK